MIVHKDNKPFFKASTSDYTRPLDSYRRKNLNRMFVAGKYVPADHPMHVPGSFKNWSEVLELQAAVDGSYYDLGDYRHETLKPGFVYVITNPAWPGWVKVGHSRNPIRRLDSYQTGAPARDYELHGYVYFSDRRAAEQEIHLRLGSIADRQDGEWFLVEQDIAVDTVKEVAEDLD